ncbi:carbohydrate esterase family 12 protein [Aplosporella prunicola CBS 121167]|uniref:Carbohydrate esterase family 12 protein n=1 Tax=Aplosporella prunicola CBS 121167 TaxID=1176127 RepID=A0A6A6BN22_9PEZI|nr:carbohydrate esterase family 12 protein [Aplosporella prunicola CBS 121167]KAF2145520.1 carbohydrate esterase family 12 protein [Aplosporella prunicola CBS 121167]
MPTKRATPKIHMAGDSTMAKGGGGSGTQGWGELLGEALNVEVVNHARAGRSARSYWEEGRFTELTDAVSSGDYVVIEFGHNDGGSLSKSDNGRTDCAGKGTETCKSADGKTVYTFPFYLIQASKAIKAKGGNLIISSQTPNNVFETGSYSFSPTRFVEYAEYAGKHIDGATYIDHNSLTATAYKSLGSDAVNAFYPNDHTHTSSDGAAVVAKAFVKGLVCADHALAAQAVDESSLPGECP